MAAAQTIWLKGEGITKEGAAGGTITPGHLVSRNTSNAYVVHAAAEGNVDPAFALEKDFVGKDISQTYASGERVQVFYPVRGAEVYALVPAAAAAIVIGDELVSNGDGTLKKINTGTALSTSNFRRVVGRALEAIDNSGGGSAVRIRVEIS